MALKEYIHPSSNCRRDLFQSLPSGIGVNPVQDKELNFWEFAIVDNGGVSTRWQIRIARLRAPDVSICSLLKWELGLSE